MIEKSVEFRKQSKICQFQWKTFQTAKSLQKLQNEIWSCSDLKGLRQVLNLLLFLWGLMQSLPCLQSLELISAHDSSEFSSLEGTEKTAVHLSWQDKRWISKY